MSLMPEVAAGRNFPFGQYPAEFNGVQGLHPNLVTIEPIPPSLAGID
jgi:hypothetical protein